MYIKYWELINYIYMYIPMYVCISYTYALDVNYIYKTIRVNELYTHTYIHTLTH